MNTTTTVSEKTLSVVRGLIGVRDSYNDGPAIPQFVMIWNAMTGNDRIGVAKECGAFAKRKSAIGQLRMCHAHVRAAMAMVG